MFKSYIIKITLQGGCHEIFTPNASHPSGPYFYMNPRCRGRYLVATLPNWNLKKLSSKNVVFKR